jgi:hypothetical protein
MYVTESGEQNQNGVERVGNVTRKRTCVWFPESYIWEEVQARIKKKRNGCPNLRISPIADPEDLSRRDILGRLLGSKTLLMVTGELAKEEKWWAKITDQAYRMKIVRAAFRGSEWFTCMILEDIKLWAICRSFDFNGTKDWSGSMGRSCPRSPNHLTLQARQCKEKHSPWVSFNTAHFFGIHSNILELVSFVI